MPKKQKQQRARGGMFGQKSTTQLGRFGGDKNTSHSPIKSGPKLKPGAKSSRND